MEQRFLHLVGDIFGRCLLADTVAALETKHWEPAGFDILAQYLVELL